MAALALEGVSKVFPGQLRAVEDLDLAVGDRELVVLVGPSGCGKTTTLRLIAGLDQVSSGVIRIDGRVVNGVTPRDRNIAMVFQESALYPHLSVYKNLGFGLSLRHGSWWFHRCWLRGRSRKTWRPEAIAERIRSTARVLGIEHLLDRMPWQLSGGERQRVALGRAIVRQPAAFLFDEPLSNLDALLRAEMRRELKRIHQRLRATMVYVTHDQFEAMTLGDRIVVMDRGRIQQIGTPTEVFQRPRNLFVAGFIGSPAMNFIRGCLRNDTGEPRFESPGFSVRLNKSQIENLRQRKDHNLVLGIRPENVHFVADSHSHGRQLVDGHGRVTVTEMLGHTTLVTLSIDKSTNTEAEIGSTRNDVVSVARSEQTVELGTQVAIWFEASRALFFDAQTGENLHAGAASNDPLPEVPNRAAKPNTEN